MHQRIAYAPALARKSTVRHGGRNEKIMHSNNDDMAKQEMDNRSRARLEIYFTGWHNRCTSNPKEHPQHPEEPRYEQMIQHRYTQSQIPDYVPLMGDV